MDEITDKAIEELAKQIPTKEIYNDLVSPGLKEVGQSFADILKIFQLALAPVQYLAAIQDRYRNFLDRSIRRIPEEARISPPPQILGPILEAIRYEPEGTTIEEMYSQLLSNSMNSERVATCHPAFPALLRQLSSDEARIIEILSKAQYDRIYARELDPVSHLFTSKVTREIDAFPKADLGFSQNLDLYIDHLNVLGLAGLYESKPQQAIMTKDERFPLENRNIQVGSRVFQQYRLTPWGQIFHSACSQVQTDRN